MSVTISPITIAGSPPPLRSFSDTFNRANSVPLGVNWIVSAIAPIPLVSPFSIPRPTIATAGAPDNGQALQWGFQGLNNPVSVYYNRMIPINLWPGLSGRTQFSQATVVQGVAGDSSAGLGVAINGDTATQYIVAYDTVLNQVRLLKIVNHTRTLLSGGHAFWGTGGVIRLSVDYSVAGQATVTYSLNGGVVASIVDAAADRIIVGIPGFVNDTTFNQTGQQWFRNFSCGPGI